MLVRHTRLTASVSNVYRVRPEIEHEMVSARKKTVLSHEHIRRRVTSESIRQIRSIH